MQTVTIPDLPDDLEPGMREHMAGQIAIQTVISVLGGPDSLRGINAVSTDELMRALAMGLSMMIAVDTRNGTPQAIRKDAEKWGKLIAGYAKILNDGDDNIAAEIMSLMGVQQESIAPN
jgi:hypothetical protein